MSLKVFGEWGFNLTLELELELELVWLGYVVWLHRQRLCIQKRIQGETKRDLEKKNRDEEPPPNTIASWLRRKSSLPPPPTIFKSNPIVYLYSFIFISFQSSTLHTLHSAVYSLYTTLELNITLEFTPVPNKSKSNSSHHNITQHTTL